MVVVLPEPLTPTIRITKGFLDGSRTRGVATGCRVFSTSPARIAFTSAGEISLS